MIPQPLIATILDQYTLNPLGIHGITHWGRVIENGLRLAETTGADVEVVTCFGVFHDACRWNDGHDSGHGRRGAELATALRSTHLRLTDRQFAQLEVACTHHTDGRDASDVTVGTCWDADRLDLGRVGIIPQPRYLSTGAARTPETIRWALDRSECEHVPDFVRTDWLPLVGAEER